MIEKGLFQVQQFLVYLEFYKTKWGKTAIIRLRIIIWNDLSDFSDELNQEVERILEMKQKISMEIAVFGKE